MSGRDLIAIRESDEYRALTYAEIEGIKQNAYAFYTVSCMTSSSIAVELGLDGDMAEFFSMLIGLGNADIIRSVLDDLHIERDARMSASIKYVLDRSADIQPENEVYSEAIVARSINILIYMQSRIKKIMPTTTINIGAMLDVYVNLCRENPNEFGIRGENEKLKRFFEAKIGCAYPVVLRKQS